MLTQTQVELTASYSNTYDNVTALRSKLAELIATDCGNG